MNFKLTVALVVGLLLVCTAYFAIPKMFPAKPAEVKNTSATPLLSPKPTGVKTISYARDGEEQVAFSRGEMGWELTFPVKSKAESWQVDSIADSLAGLAYKEKFETEATGEHSVATTGTDKPRYVVTFTDDAGKEHKLNLGKRTVGGIYATLDGSKTVYLLAADPLESLDKPAQSFRDKNIRDVDTDKVVELTINHGEHTTVLNKSGDKWLISKPVSARANEAKVKDVLAELKAIRASGFTDIEKDSAATGLNPPVASVTALVEEPAAATQKAATAPASAPATAKTSVTLQLGFYTGLMDKKNVYASIVGTNEVFTLDAKSFDKLNRELSDLRDPSISPAMIGDATEATQTTDGKVAAKVVKKDGVWTLASTPPLPTPVKAGDLEVGDWLGDIRNLRAIKFVDNAGDLKSIGLDPPVTRLEMTIPEQTQHEVILIGKPETADKVTPMMRQGEPTVYLVQTGDAKKVLRTDLELRDKVVERLSANRIRSIVVTGKSASGGGFELQREGTSWNVMSGGKSAKADDEKITGILAELSPLTAAKYISEKVDASGTPDVTATVSFVEDVVTAARRPATTSAPATLPAGLGSAVAGPKEGKIVTRTLKLFKTVKDSETTWRGVWDGTPPQWTFEPTPALLQHLTKETYAVTASTQPTTQAATQPAK